MQIGTVSSAMKLGIVLKDQIGKTLTINFGVIDHFGYLDCEEEDAKILSGLEPYDTLTKKLLLTDDLEEVLGRLDKLYTLVTTLKIQRSFYFEGFEMKSGNDHVTVTLCWGS
jgi:hypothetical protein